jgi:hypothetical protein
MKTLPRPELSEREWQLLAALQRMRGWVIHHTEPCISGRGAMYENLVRDLAFASKTIEEATGGNES